MEVKELICVVEIIRLIYWVFYDRGHLNLIAIDRFFNLAVVGGRFIRWHEVKVW